MPIQSSPTPKANQMPPRPSEPPQARKGYRKKFPSCSYITPCTCMVLPLRSTSSCGVLLGIEVMKSRCSSRLQEQSTGENTHGSHGGSGEAVRRASSDGRCARAVTAASGLGELDAVPGGSVRVDSAVASGDGGGVHGSCGRLGRAAGPSRPRCVGSPWAGSPTWN